MHWWSGLELGLAMIGFLLTVWLVALISRLRIKFTGNKEQEQTK